MDKIKVEFGAEAAELISSMDEYKQASAALAQADEQLAVANQSDSAQSVVEPASAPQTMPLKVPQIDTNPAPAAPPPFPPPGPTPQTVPTTENPSDTKILLRYLATADSSSAIKTLRFIIFLHLK
jgi:hypothetical protein